MKLSKTGYSHISLPGDKSIAHRALILASFAKGKHQIDNFPTNEDVLSTLKIFHNYGLKYKFINDKIMIDSSNLLFKDSIIDCNESGTTARLLIGYFSGLNTNVKIQGSSTLLQRPMKRIVQPLKNCGVNIVSNNYQLPLKINKGTDLKSIDYNLDIPSAQVKSGLILYAMSINGKSTLRGQIHTRDHLENLLISLGYPIHVNEDKIEINGGAKINKNIDMKIPGDFSSASFIICIALLKRGCSIKINDVGINKYRIGFLEAAIQMGAKINISNKQIMYGEPIADISIDYSDNLRGIVIDKISTVRMIDEIPILSVLACYAEGETVIHGIAELKVKESNRVKSIIDNIQVMGGYAKLEDDSLVIKGKKRLYNTTIKSFDDHRIFMSFYIANRLISEKVYYDMNDTSYNKSFPNFISMVEGIFA